MIDRVCTRRRGPPRAHQLAGVRRRVAGGGRLGAWIVPSDPMGTARTAGHIDRTRPVVGFCPRPGGRLPARWAGTMPVIEVDEADARWTGSAPAASRHWPPPALTRPRRGDVHVRHYRRAQGRRDHSGQLRVRRRDDGRRRRLCARASPARRAAGVPRQRAVLQLRLRHLGRRVGGADAHVLGRGSSPRASCSCRGPPIPPGSRARCSRSASGSPTAGSRWSTSSAERSSWVLPVSSWTRVRWLRSRPSSRTWVKSLRRCRGRGTRSWRSRPTPERSPMPCWRSAPWHTTCARADALDALAELLVPDAAAPVPVVALPADVPAWPEAIVALLGSRG